MASPLGRRLEESFAIENNLEFSSRHPLTEKALVIFRFRAAVEATNRIVSESEGEDAIAPYQ